MLCLAGVSSSTVWSGQGAKALVRTWARKKNVPFELNPTWDIPRLIAFLDSYREKCGLQPPAESASDGFEAVPVDFRQFPVLSKSKMIEGHLVVNEPPITEGAIPWDVCVVPLRFTSNFSGHRRS
jgi:hypothetical protein